MTKINAYIHIAAMGNFMPVTNTILNEIKKSGLYEIADKIYLVINGNKDLVDQSIYDPKYTVLSDNRDVSKCEFPTLDVIWEDCQKSQEDFLVLYVHTKGVTRTNFPPVQDWIKYLVHFNVSSWQDRVKDLIVNDCSGVNLRGYQVNFKANPLLWSSSRIPLHYSGNFWWSKSSHIKKLPKPSNWVPSKQFFKYRIMAEMWLCQVIGGKYHCAWESGIDHYKTFYPEKMYVGDGLVPGKSPY